MGYAFVEAAWDYSRARAPILAIVDHMAEGGGTVSYLDDVPPLPPRGNSSHYVVEYSGRVVQMVRDDRAAGSIDPTKIRTDDDPDGLYGISHAIAVLDGYARDPNVAVIAIELEGFAREGPNAKQATALAELHADLRARHPTIRGQLGHRDFQDYKACPGHHIPWELVGGHGLFEEDVMQAPITSEDEKLVTTAQNGSWYDLDGKTVISAGHPALAARRSPYGVGSKRAIFAEIPAGSNQRRLVLVVPASVAPVPSPDAAAKAAHDATKAAAVKAVEAIP
jgi:hypothetical protein